MQPFASSRGSWCERLEPRTLLAAYMGDPVPDAPASIAGGNDSHTILFTEVVKTAGQASNQWVYAADSWTLVSDLPGFGPGAFVSGVDDDGRFIGYAASSTLGAEFFVSNGVRSSIADAVTSWIGETPDASVVRITGLANGGWALLGEDADSTGDLLPRSWRLKDGVATLVGSFRATVNSQGAVLPDVYGPTDPAPRALLLADGSQLSIPELGNHARLSDNNTVAWIDPSSLDQNLKIWNSGVITGVDLHPSTPSSAFLPYWSVASVNNSGRMILGLVISDPIAHISVPPVLYIFDPATGEARKPEELVWGVKHYGDAVFPGTAVQLGNDDSLLTSASILTSIDDGAPWLARDGTSIAATASADSTLAAGVNQFGDAVVLVRREGAWAGFRLAMLDSDHPPAVGGQFQFSAVLPFIDAVTGNPSAFVVTDTEDFVAKIDLYFAYGVNGHIPVRVVAAVPIEAPASTAALHNLAVFESIDHQTYLTGTDAAGDLVAYFPKDPTKESSASNWSYSNLTAEHLEADGKVFTPVAGGLTAFVAPWNGMHIAYLDGAGAVRVVWWAPGMTHWTTDNLSVIAGAPALHGSLTAFVTSWNGLNVAGTDESGNLAALWWVPQFGAQWRYDRLADDNGPKLASDSLASFTTPWGGLNVTGLDAGTGAVTVYWWTPETDQWRAEPFAVEGGPSSVTAQSAPAPAQATPDGLLQVFFIADDLSVQRLHWSPGDGAAWHLEEVSAALS